MTSEFTLYGTSACHLCDLALEAAQPVADKLGIRLQITDISENDELFERYGLIIPVLSNNHGAELRWPFGMEHVDEFMRSQKN